MHRQSSGQVSALMVAALEQAWAAIRSRHPDVPAAVIVLGAGSVGTPEGMLRLGHFAAMRWRTDADGAEQLAEGVRRWGGVDRDLEPPGGVAGVRP